MTIARSNIQRRYEKTIKKIRHFMDENGCSVAAHLKGADLLREWIFRHTPRASGEPGTLCTTEPYPYDTAHILQQLHDDRTGYWCAGYASLLVCAYRDLGMKAATIAFGIEEGFSHAITAVKVGSMWFLQDPYTNVRFTVVGTDNASFATIWQQVNDGLQVQTIASFSRLQPLIFCQESTLSKNVFFPSGHHQLENKKRVGLFHVSVGQFYQHPLWPSSEPKMLRKSGQDPLSALFCHTLWLSDSEHGYFPSPKNHPLWNEMTGDHV